MNNGKKKPKVAIKNGQSRETGNIGYTRHRTKTNKTYDQFKTNMTIDIYYQYI